MTRQDLPRARKRASQRWIRRLCASSLLVLAITDLIQALSRHSRAHLGRLSVHLGGTTTQLFRYVLLLAAVTLLAMIRGLLRGKRNALRLGIAACAVSLIGHHAVRADIVGIGLAASVFVVLMLNRRLFVARQDPIRVGQAVFWLVTGLSGAYLYGVAGLYLLDSGFRRATTLRQSLGQAARLLFLLPVSTIEPDTRHGHWFVDSVRVTVVFVLVVGLVGLLRPVALRTQSERELNDVSDVLARYASSSLAFFHLLVDKHHLFSADREAFIGYKLVGSVAVSLGGPIGSPAARREVTEQFLDICELNGWLPAFHQVTPDALDELTEFGLRSLKVGEEAVLDLRTFSLQGSHFKSIRSKTAKMEREGWRVETLTAPIHETTLERLRNISDAWLGDGGHRERTFTVGQFDDDYLRSTPVLVAFDPDNTIRGFTNFIPNYNSVNGNFDLMRRDPTVRLPVMDLLFVKMIEQFRTNGLEGMTLGLAPFANIDGTAIVDRALKVLFDHGGRAFNFTGLRDFKDKWRPRWEPRYLVYRSDAELPSVALGVSRAGELPTASSSKLEAATGWLGSVARMGFFAARRLPFTAAVSIVVIALQLATAIDKDAYGTLVNMLHYNWSDLAQHAQLYRIPASIFLQDGPGIRPGLVSMIPLIAASEYILRPGRTALIFFLGDIASGLPILLALRFAAALGNVSARTAIGVRDGGISSAMFAVVAGALVATTNSKLRKWGGVLLAGYLLGDTLIEHRIFSLQHIGGILVGVACAHWLDGWRNRAPLRAGSQLGGASQKRKSMR